MFKKNNNYNGFVIGPSLFIKKNKPYFYLKILYTLNLIPIYLATVTSTLLLLFLSLLYQLSYTFVNTNSFWKKSFICHTELKLSSLFDSWLARKNHLQINAFSNLMLVEQKKSSYTLQKKISEQAINKIIKETTS